MTKNISTSKWTKYKLLNRSSTLSRHLPKTMWLRESSLYSFLDRYGEVIVKPTGKWGGSGVMRVRKVEGWQYELQRDTKVQTFSSKESLYAYLRSKITKNYIVQQRISLATVQHRPFDLRVMVQRKRGSSTWKLTGKLAKVAGKGYIITNVARSGGKIVTVEHALQKAGITDRRLQDILSDIDRVAMLSAKQLYPRYRWVRAMGVDIGVDKSGHVWIIEVNYKPTLSLFNRLKDRTMYRTILAYSK
ncbi:YheC/YheD family protein [Paenibacillus silviterrae]|uniref:YheC/YheD family protein n=1 Tax=Paenibacillus silviterrae TaxID=3242194 RepID=UPI002542E6D8|nr:YheC/YheD family protein [Paenibacillus chinjuensis]